MRYSSLIPPPLSRPTHTRIHILQWKLFITKCHLSTSVVHLLKEVAILQEDNMPAEKIQQKCCKINGSTETNGLGNLTRWGPAGIRGKIIGVRKQITTLNIWLNRNYWNLEPLKPDQVSVLKLHLMFWDASEATTQLF